MDIEYNYFITCECYYCYLVATIIKFGKYKVIIKYINGT